MNSQQTTLKRSELENPQFAFSERGVRNLFDNAPVGIFASTIEGKMLKMNVSGARMFGYDSPEEFVDEVTDTPKQLFVYPEQRAELVRNALASNQFVRAEVSYLRRDGSIFVAHLYMRAVRDAHGRPMFMDGFVEDITERKRAEVALQLNEVRYRTLIENAPLPIGISRNAIVTYVNRKFVELYRCGSAEAQVGRAITDFWAPKYRAAVDELVLRRSQGLSTPTTYQGVAQRGDGSQFPVQVSAVMVHLPDGPATLAFLTDITDLKQAQEQLRQHQEHLEELVTARTADLHSALAELEHMSYSMVHDMRAPLRAMQGFARLILDECPEALQGSGLEYLNLIIQASNRLDRLITDALSYNKVVRENLPMRHVHVGKLLLGMIQSYPNLRPPAVEIEVASNANVVVCGNESLLTQCFSNLLDNAVKFVAPGARPHIRIWAKSSTLDQQPSVIICVGDNGIGIPKKAQQNIFRMFQRMHNESRYPGTGIGLAIVKKAVERMGGRVGLESAPGKGSTFSVELLCPSSIKNKAPVTYAI
jgi:PAS domain S-box-containing protein